MDGKRVELDGSIGTVKFYGSLESVDGLWLGVEWDDSTRGKHNGFHNGKQYFETRHATSGSFVRHEKTNFGLSFMTAVAKKYLDSTQELSADERNLFIVSKSNSLINVEPVGMDKVRRKQGQFELMTTVGLGRMLVNGLAPTEDLTSLMPNIRELDLSGSLIASWVVVAAICKQLVHLVDLNISNNRLEMPERPGDLAASFHKLETLQLMNVGYNWQQVIDCSAMWPDIFNLFVGRNCITDFNASSGLTVLFASLIRLDLEGNALTDGWCGILGFTIHAPNLQTLNLSNTGISEIEYPSPGWTYLPKVTSLVLNDNNLKRWRDLDELNNLGCLTELVIRNNPLLDTDKPVNIRQMIIARLGGLTKLNRTPITQQERQGAELDYLKVATSDMSETGRSRHAFLIEKHGVQAPSCQADMTLKSKLMTVEIICPEINSAKPITRKLPNNMTVQKLKLLVRKLFQLGNVESNLSYLTKGVEVTDEYQLDNDLQTLSFYGIKENDLILVRTR